MYTFFDEGFFGYGEPGDFQYYSFWHFLPIFLLICGIVLLYKKKDALREWKWEGRFRFIMAFVMLLVEMSFFWRLLYVGDELGIHNLMTKLPLQVCQWALFACVFMVMSKNDTLFGICFFLSITLGLIPLLMPTVITRTGPTYYRYYQFWLEHELPIFMTYYMIFVHGKRPKYKDIWVTQGCLVLLSIPCVIANSRIPGANYMYMNGESQGGAVGGNIAQWFPESQRVRYIAFFFIVLLMFHLSYWIYTRIRDRKANAQPAGSKG